MIEGLKLMQCGNCGGHEFNIYNSIEGKMHLWAECKNCLSTSTISFTEPRIQIGWGHNSKGILCNKHGD